MYKFLLRFCCVFIAITAVGCAKRGNITGGAKDTLAPILKSSLPKNFSTNFTGKEVKLYFDEYIKLKDVNKQLVISPPMNAAPDILPTTASKYISIKIKDTLLPNTTYSFNFGQSIQDNNEGNPYPQFKYVFSTGDAIDSLSVEGSVKDALEQKVDNFVSVLLYEVNEKYNDSTIYKEKPRYVTNTLDSLKTWKIENIKAGKYVLIALKDYNNNYKFDAKKDKIGFLKEEIVIPTSSTFAIKLFKEKVVFKALKPAQASGNRAIFGFEGDAKNIKIILKNGQQILPNIVTKVDKKDSVNVWFNKIKVDSLSLNVVGDNFNKNYTFKIKDQKRDTLSFAATPIGALNFREQFVISATIPIVKVDDAKFSLVDKDEVAVPFVTIYDTFNQQLKINFKKGESQKYTFQILPGAMVDFYGKQNDSLTYKLTTRSTTEYGNLILKLENVKQFPMIVQLTNEMGEVLAFEYAENSPIVTFENLLPDKYYLRVIYDANKNKEWDSGNFIEKRQSEEVLYFPKLIDVRANSDVDQPFDLGD